MPCLLDCYPVFTSAAVSYIPTCSVPIDFLRLPCLQLALWWEYISLLIQICTIINPSSAFTAYVVSIIEPWHVVLTYQLVNIFCFFFNCYGKILPDVANAALYTSLLSFLIILITVPAKAPTHEEAQFVFANFVNNTGWASNGIGFIVGLINTNWAFACLDCATHMAEEVPRPERTVPFAIMGTVAIGFVTSWFYSIAMFFSMQNLDDLFNTPTLVPMLELFNQALGNWGGAIVLESLIIATAIGCLIASHTWQSRLCWSFARDRGLPGWRYLGEVKPTLDVPVLAHFGQSTRAESSDRTA